MSRAGAHAGRLHPLEQFVFAMVFALMAGFVVIITMSAVKSPVNSLLGSGTTAAESQTVPAGTRGTAGEANDASAATPPIQAASPRLDARLAAAVGPVLSAHPGRLAVGVIDETTGRQARYGSTQRFNAGPFVTEDILAALLIRHERAGTSLSRAQEGLTTAMDDGSVPAAAALWRQIGQGNGLAAANHLLNLTQTIPGTGDQFDQTRTTVADELRLLIDLTSSRSPMTAASRDYMLRVLAAHGPGPRWGVSAVAGSNTVQGGWRSAGPLWITNSVGIVARAGHVLLVVVVSSSSTSQAAAASLASAAAVVVTSVMIGSD